jgi:hypothetical protein
MSLPRRRDVTGIGSAVTVGSTDLRRGIRALITLSSSYVFREPARVLVGAFSALPVPVALVVAPWLSAGSAVLRASALVSALRIAWRVRTAPVLEPRADLSCAAAALAPVCALITDTHVTADGHSPVELDEDPRQWPSDDLPTTAALCTGLRRVLTRIHRNGPRTVIWCGDVVDTGSSTEWAHWQAVVDTVPGLAHRVVPGNHDVCFNRPFDEDYSLARRAERERAFQQHGDRLADFPIVDTIVGDFGSATLLLLDSCKHRSTHILSNAIGKFGQVQLDEVERALATRTGPVLCISHHHVWRDASFMQPDEWYNTTVDADRLVRILLAYRRRSPRNHVLVCHGHRHALVTGSITDGDVSIDVVGMPSSTLGDKANRPTLDGITRFAVAGMRADGSWGIAFVAVGELVATRSSRSDEAARS